MKPLRLLIILLVLAVVGCAVLIPVAKFLAIPVAQHLLADDDKDESKDERNEDELKENEE